MAAWSNAALKVLRGKLAALYDERPAQKQFLLDAGWSNDDLVRITWHQAPLYAWFNILEYGAPRPPRVDLLVARLKADLPEDTEVAALAPDMAAPAVEPPALTEPWKGRPGLEATLSSIPTLVPVRWLREGFERARSVGRVNLPLGYGTGFLVRGKDGDLLLTNHHVLGDEAGAAASTVTFNFEEGTGNAPVVSDTWQLDVTRFWTSEVDGGDDWTAVGVGERLVGGQTVRASDLYGTIDLDPIVVAVDERVNIVQHPGGLAKQVSCVSNVVAAVSARRVQYLTDTRPGSSGAPVFNRDWKLVALHHSSVEGPGGPQGHFLRNEGIPVGPIHAALLAAGAI